MKKILRAFFGAPVVGLAYLFEFIKDLHYKKRRRVRDWQDRQRK